MAELCIRVDDALKQDVELILDDIGLTISAAMSVFFRQIVRCNGIPFELRADPFYSVENQARLLAAKERMENGGGTVHELIETDD